MSGVSVLTTDSDCTSSDGSTSSATARRLLSGEGTSVPLMVTLFRSGAMPRTLTKRPSPGRAPPRSPNALQRFGGVVIRQLADAVGVDHVLDAVGTALVLQCLVDADGLADDLDMLHDQRLSAQAEPALTAASRLMRNPAWRMPLRYVFMNDSRMVFAGSIPELQ